NDAERFADLGKRRDRLVELSVGVGRAHLRSYPRFALGNHGIREADDIDALREQRVSHSRRESRIAEHDGNDRMLAGHEIEAELAHRLPKAIAVRAETAAQRRALFTFQDIDDFE